MDHQPEELRKDRVDDRVVSYLVYESSQARSERTIKRLIIALIMTIILLFLSNAIWIHEWSQYEYDEIAYEQDGDGLNSINFGRQGDLTNEPKIDYQTQTEEESGNE